MRNRMGRAAALATLLLVTTITGCAKREVYVGTDSGPAATTGGEGAGSGAAASNQSLVSELERLSVAQQAFFDENDYYAGSLDALGFSQASGVRIDVIQGDALGFSAIARSGENECAIYRGEVRSPRSYLSAPDVPACRS